MKNALDQIETHLQSFIESSALIIPDSSPNFPLAHRLVKVMQDCLQTDENGNLTAPGLYIVNVHPHTFDQWQNADDIFTNLASALQESARDNGIIFQIPPTIRLSIDPLLAVGDIQINASEISNQGGYTTALIISEENNALKNENDSPKTEAYLIINGDELFSLNQTVINIGRRSDNHLVINDPRVSRTHCQLRMVHHSYVLFDLNSTGGTFINNIRTTRQSLKAGDVISLAGVQLIYGEDVSAQTTGRLLINQGINHKTESSSQSS